MFIARKDTDSVDFLCEDYILYARVLGRHVAVVPVGSIPQGWSRIPPRVARTLFFHVSATWMYPLTAMEGFKEWERVISSWLDYISSPCDEDIEPDDMRGVSFAGFQHSGTARPTLADVDAWRHRRNG